MNKIISNHHISPEIIDLIKNSKKYVVLISPYLWLWGHLKDEIIRCVTEREVKVLLIIKDFENDFSKNKSSIQLNKRKGLIEEVLHDFVIMGVDVYTNTTLHSKLYMSEKVGLVCSMNLYEYSMKSNEELGVVIDDDDSLKELNNYVKELKSNSYKYELPVEEGFEELITPDRFGTCIRCGKSDIKEPLSSDHDNIFFESLDEHYRSQDEFKIDTEEEVSTYHLCQDCLPKWKKYSNVEYREKYCFVCGEEHKTSVKRPFCKDCTYERKWNDDDFKKEVVENMEKYFKEHGIDD